MTVQFSEHSATRKGLVTPNHCPWDPGGSEPKGLNDSEVAKTETFLGLPGGAANRIGGGGRLPGTCPEPKALWQQQESTSLTFRKTPRHQENPALGHGNITGTSSAGLVRLEQGDLPEMEPDARIIRLGPKLRGQTARRMAWEGCGREATVGLQKHKPSRRQGPSPRAPALHAPETSASHSGVKDEHPP